MSDIRNLRSFNSFKKHFPLQKLKKVCAECGEDIEGVYYTGRDKRTLCEAHYKVQYKTVQYSTVQYRQEDPV